MTAKTVEDLIFTDDLRALGADLAPTEHYRAGGGHGPERIRTH